MDVEKRFAENIAWAEKFAQQFIQDQIIAECDDCGKELTRDDVAYHYMEDDTGAWFYYCSDCAPRSYYE